MISFMGCGKDESQDEELKMIDVSIDAQEMIDETGKIAFSIATNLPDETELMLTLTENGGNYRGQGKVVIKDNAGISEKFSQKGDALPAGQYKLDISMSLAKFQTESVQSVIGVDGEYLTGDLVKQDDMGNHVSASYEFEIK